MQLPFGKYKGQEIGDIPTEYLKWAEENCDLHPSLRKEVNQELSRRSSPETSRGKELDSPTYKPFEEMIYDMIISWLKSEVAAGRVISPIDKQEACQVSLITTIKREYPIKVKLYKAQKRGQ